MSWVFEPVLVTVKTNPTEYPRVGLSILALLNQGYYVRVVKEFSCVIS